MSHPTYTPQPIDTSRVALPADLAALTERLAENAHDLWAQERLAQGWTYGPQRDDAGKKHPGLVPYADLSDAEKRFDIETAMGTLKAVAALDYAIEGRGATLAPSDAAKLASWCAVLEKEAASAQAKGPRAWTFDMDDAPELEGLEKAGLDQAHAALAEIQAQVFPAWQHEDAEAIRLQHWHHRIATCAIWPGILAIVCAILQLTASRILGDSHAAVWWAGVLETGSVIFATIAIVVGVFFHLHHGWLAHRQRAERLRILKFSALGWPELWCDFAAWKKRLAAEVATLRSVSTVAAHHWATQNDKVRPELPAPPACTVPGSDLQALSLLYRIKRLAFQRHYFEFQTAKAQRSSWFVDRKGGLWIFGLSVIIVLLHGFHALPHFPRPTPIPEHAAPVSDHANLVNAPTTPVDPHITPTTPHTAPTTPHTAPPSDTIEIVAISLAAILPVIGFGFRAWFAAFEAPRSRNLYRAKTLALDDYIARSAASASDVEQTLHHIAHGEHFFTNEHREWCRLQMEAEWFV